MTIYTEAMKVQVIEKVFCPECNSEDISYEDITPERINRYSMDELPTKKSGGWGYTDQWIGRKVKATCDQCEYSIEYWDKSVTVI
jgi:hypothetical protein